MKVKFRCALSSLADEKYARSRINQKIFHSKKQQRNEAHPGAPLSSSEFLLGSTVRGLCRPEDRSNKINQRF